MKKIFTAIILSAFLIVGNNFCSAAMPQNEMYLGGLTYGTSTAKFIRMYGSPSRTEGGVEYMYTCYYGESVSINYDAYKNAIFSIKVTDNNGWHTPKGLAVGMPISKAIELYGNADFEKYGADKAAYVYFHNNGKCNNYGLIILVDSYTDKILSLEITGDNSMVNFEDFFEPTINYQLGIEEIDENKSENVTQ